MTLHGRIGFQLIVAAYKGVYFEMKKSVLFHQILQLPNSSIIVEPPTVRYSLFPLPPATKQQKTPHVTGAKLSNYVFSKEAAPMQFRSYLTFAATEDFEDSKVIDNQFWVSEVIQTSVAPEMLPNKSSDQFYVSEFTGFAQFTIAILGLVLIAVFALTD